MPQTHTLSLIIGGVPVELREPSLAVEGLWTPPCWDASYSYEDILCDELRPILLSMRCRATVFSFDETIIQRSLSQNATAAFCCECSGYLSSIRKMRSSVSLVGHCFLCGAFAFVVGALRRPQGGLLRPPDAVSTDDGFSTLASSYFRPTVLSAVLDYGYAMLPSVSFETPPIPVKERSQTVIPESSIRLLGNQI